jgi:hypothetical protein
MKNFLRGVYVIIKGIGYARAAAFHARQGDHKRANQIMEEYAKCK